MPTSTTTGRIDVATTAGILPNAGGGTFGPTWAFSSSVDPPDEIASADFNSDGLPDLATSAPVTVWLNQGDGSSQTSATLSGVGGKLAPGDLNGDGATDLIAVNGQEVWVLINDGHAAFTPHLNGGPVGAQSARVVDLDGDGDLDIFLATRSSGAVTMLNIGNGSFKPWKWSPVREFSRCLRKAG